MTELRIIDKPLVKGRVRIYAEYTNYPTVEYAVMLQVKVGRQWQTIRLYDNAHGSNEMHRYTGVDKQPAAPFLEDRPPDEAMPAAIAYLDDSWEEVLDAWQR